MAVLEADAPLQRRDQLAEGERPVRHRERRAGRGHQSAHEDEAEGRACGQHRKAMQSAGAVGTISHSIHLTVSCEYPIACEYPVPCEYLFRAISYSAQ